MPRLFIIVPDAARRSWLESVFGADPELTVLGSATDFDPATRLDPRMIEAEVVVIDLALPRATDFRFWAALHVLYPWVRLMAVTEPPIDPKALQAALHAGAYYMVEWTDPQRRLCAVARAAGSGEGYIPLGAVITAMAELFDRLNLDAPTIQIGDLRLDLTTRQVKLGPRSIGLTATECQLLAYLARNANRVIPAPELYQAIWHSPPHSRKWKDLVKKSIMRLRHKIEPDHHTPCYVRTMRGRGYFLTVRVAS